ncbi:MAG: hypothetical protein ACXQT1_03860 [Methermicoccaceae archaeon]
MAWLKKRYGPDKHKKALFRLANILDYFSKKRGIPLFGELATILREEAKKVKKPTKKPPKLEVEDIQTELKAVYDKPCSQEPIKCALGKLRMLSALILQAYTGIRPEILNRVSQEDFVLDGKYPHLKVKAEYDKNRFEHDVPLHPDVVRWLRAYFDALNNPSIPEHYKPNTLWHTGMMSRKIKEACKGAGTKYLTFEMIRKFAEQAHKWLAGLPEFARTIIMSHEVGRISAEHYDYADASRLYPVYMKHWGDIHIVPSEVRLDGLMGAL